MVTDASDANDQVDRGWHGNHYRGGFMKAGIKAEFGILTGFFDVWYEFRVCFFFSSRRRHTRCSRDWSSDVCSSDLWRARSDLGTFPIRFPSPDDPGDAGWHVDNSFPHDSSDTGDFLNWRINVVSKGRALLMLFLFSDVGENGAPTRIRVGSHLDVARILAPLGETGFFSRGLAAHEGLSKTASRHQVAATGDPGTGCL